LPDALPILADVSAGVGADGRPAGLQGAQVAGDVDEVDGSADGVAVDVAGEAAGVAGDADLRRLHDADVPVAFQVADQGGGGDDVLDVAADDGRQDLRSAASELVDEGGVDVGAGTGGADQADASLDHADLSGRGEGE